MSEVFLPIITLTLVSILIAYKRGWTTIVIEKYKEIDDKDIALESFLFIVSPFLVTKVFNCLNRNSLMHPDSNIIFSETNNPLAKIPFQAMATGVGIIFGNSVISLIKKQSDRNEIRSISILVIREQSQYVGLIRNAISDVSKSNLDYSYIRRGIEKITSTLSVVHIVSQLSVCFFRTNELSYLHYLNRSMP